MASISPTGIGQLVYTITASRRALADLRLNFSFGMQYVAFKVTYPTAAAGVQVQLSSPTHPAPVDLLPGLVNDVSFPNRLLNTSTAVIGPNTELTCRLQATFGDAVAEPYTVRLGAGAATDWTFRQDDNDPGGLTIERLMCDPVAQITSVVPPAPKEKDNVTVTAAPGIAVGTVVAALPPTLTYRWSYTGTIVVDGPGAVFPSEGPSPTKVFEAPGVYGPRSIDVQVEVWPVWDGGTTGQFLTTSATSPVTIDPTAQHLMVVLDRSGSMSGSRWETAVIAARMVTQMYLALRSGVNDARDRIGILVFEDSACTWRAFWSPSPAIELRLAVGKAGDNEPVDLCTLDLGMPGSCTPIGDGLIRAMWEMQPFIDPGDKPRCHIVLLTDGYENSGSVYLKSTPSAIGAGAQSFASRRGGVVDGRDLSVFNNRLNIYPIGLGSTVDDQVLNQLNWGESATPTVYRNVLDVSEIKNGIADMLAFSQEAQPLPSATTPGALSGIVGVPVPTDPAPPANARYLLLEPKANRMVLTIEWPIGAHGIELARWDGGSYAFVDAALSICDRHGFAWVDLAGLYGGEDLVPQTFWRVTHTDGGAAVPIADSDFLAYLDLAVKATIRFDRPEYRTGDAMIVSCSIREGSLPVRGARVTVELARPGESLGTFLAENNQLYNPGREQGPDPAPPKEDMLRQLLAGTKRDSLIVPSPPKIFADGTNELFDDGTHEDGADNDGNYANIYKQVDKEGAYTFRFLITGTLSDGSGFNRLLVVSTWCGIRVDPSASTTAITPLGTSGSLIQVQIKVTPRDASGEFLGPFRADEISFSTTAGAFQGEIESQLDGSYTQVLAYREGDDPVVTITVQDQPFPRLPVTQSPGLTPPKPSRVCAALLRCLRRLADRLERCCGPMPK